MKLCTENGALTGPTQNLNGIQLTIADPSSGTWKNAITLDDLGSTAFPFSACRILNVNVKATVQSLTVAYSSTTGVN